MVKLLIASTLLLLGACSILPARYSGSIQVNEKSVMVTLESVLKNVIFIDSWSLTIDGVFVGILPREGQTFRDEGEKTIREWEIQDSVFGRILVRQYDYKGNANIHFRFFIDGRDAGSIFEYIVIKRQSRLFTIRYD